MNIQDKIKQAEERTLELSNISLTIICEKTKINSFREQLKANLSKIWTRHWPKRV